MTSNKRIIAFAIYAIGLIGFPIWMIVQENNTFTEGDAYKFKCEPVDPNDPFRGKYIRLRFENITFSDSLYNFSNIPIYGQVSINADGYAYISKVDDTQPSDGPYLELEITNSWKEGWTNYELPFDRLYMNENKAQAAEDRYRNALRDSTQSVYARVYISGDRYLLDDVYIDDVRLSDTLD